MTATVVKMGGRDASATIIPGNSQVTQGGGDVAADTMVNMSWPCDPSARHGHGHIRHRIDEFN